MNKWYKLDNAAKVFPSVTSKRRSNLFRLAFILKEEIVPEVLEKALEYTINRFPSMKVKIKKGLFWYYFEPNNEKPILYEEDPYICSKFNYKENKNYLFKVNYYYKRISIEVFHALTDGAGAMEFLKALVYNYLIMLGNKVDSENLILTDEIENIKEEHQDSFLKNYNLRYKHKTKEKKALQWKGTLYQENWLALVTGELSVSAIKEVAYRYDATITEFIGACVIYSASKSLNLFENKHKPFQLFVPVDLRRLFPSKTLRNFSLFVRSTVDIEKQLTFEEVISIVKGNIREEVQKDKMLSRIVKNVSIEKNIFLRLVPLVIKEILLKVGYRIQGDKANSSSLSNLGKVNLPKDMRPYINRIEFCIGASYRAPVNLGIVSFEEKLVISFASAIVERDMIREFFRLISSFGIEVLIETNELEVF